MAGTLIVCRRHEDRFLRRDGVVQPVRPDTAGQAGADRDGEDAEVGARNKVEAQPAQACKSDGEALRTGERMAKRFLGVAVISQAYDEMADFAADLAVLATHGTVPDQWDEFEVAA